MSFGNINIDDMLQEPALTSNSSNNNNNNDNTTTTNGSGTSHLDMSLSDIIKASTKANRKAKAAKILNKVTKSKVAPKGSITKANANRPASNKGTKKGPARLTPLQQNKLNQIKNSKVRPGNRQNVKNSNELKGKSNVIQSHLTKQRQNTQRANVINKARNNNNQRNNTNNNNNNNNSRSNKKKNLNSFNSLFNNNNNNNNNRNGPQSKKKNNSSNSNKKGNGNGSGSGSIKRNTKPKGSNKKNNNNNNNNNNRPRGNNRGSRK